VTPAEVGEAGEVLGMAPAVFAAVIAASAAVVVAVYGQVATVRRETANRRHAQRRTALVDLQDAAAELRTELRAYGIELRRALDLPSPLPGTVSPDIDSTRLRRAEALVDIRIVRLDDTIGHRPVAAAVRAWRETASEHFLSPSTVYASEEGAAWARVNEAVRTALSP
jgi:hypothetical protein